MGTADRLPTADEALRAAIAAARHADEVAGVNGDTDRVIASTARASAWAAIADQLAIRDHEVMADAGRRGGKAGETLRAVDGRST